MPRRRRPGSPASPIWRHPQGNSTQALIQGGCRAVLGRTAHGWCHEGSRQHEGQVSFHGGPAGSWEANSQGATWHNRRVLKTKRMGGNPQQCSRELASHWSRSSQAFLRAVRSPAHSCRPQTGSPSAPQCCTSGSLSTQPTCSNRRHVSLLRCCCATVARVANHACSQLALRCTAPSPGSAAVVPYGCKLKGRTTQYVYIAPTASS